MTLDSTEPARNDPPLVRDVEALDHDTVSRDYRLMQRDERVLDELREKLRRHRGKPGPKAGERKAAGTDAATDHDDADGDLYEPQRLTRKICWQYDQQGRKVPMLRRPYLE